jgi:hypothetical protein
MKLAIDYSKVMSEVDKKVEGITEVAKPRNQEAIAKAVFTVAGKEFIRQTSIKAMGSPKAYHHIYEWNKTGVTKYKLFELNRTSVAGGNLKISTYFINSKSQVPIPKALTVPGRNGRFVSKRFVFKDKATVMESGKPVKPFSAKSGIALVFLGKDKKPMFIRRPRKTRIVRPGGRYTTFAYTNHFSRWFENPTNINSAMRKSGMYKDLEIKIAKTLNKTGAGQVQVSQAMQEVANKYSKGVKLL